MNNQTNGYKRLTQGTYCNMQKNGKKAPVTHGKDDKGQAPKTSTLM